MAVARAQGMPDYEGRQIDEIWSMEYVDTYYDSTVHRVMSITELQEGSEITAHGNKVHMQHIPVTHPKPYTVGMPIDIEYPDADEFVLEIDKADYLAFAFNRVDLKQMRNKNYRAKTIDDAVQRMRLAIETPFLADTTKTAHVRNKGLTAGTRRNIRLGTTSMPAFIAPDKVGAGTGVAAATAMGVIRFFLNCKEVLDNQNVPQVGRYMIVPDGMATIMLDSPLKQVQYSGDDQSMVRKGYIGSFAGFAIYQSHLLPVTGSGAATKYTLACGIPYAVQFATQLVYDRDFDIERGFERAHKRLQVYGYDTQKSEALCTPVVQLTG